MLWAAIVSMFKQPQRTTKYPSYDRTHCGYTGNLSTSMADVRYAYGADDMLVEEQDSK